MDEQSFEVRDLRQKEKFFINDVLIDKFAKIIGIYTVGVYASLCRHSDRGQTCWPSCRLIAEELGISRKQVGRCIKTLEEHNIIRHQRQGKTLNNQYYLMDKAKWSEGTHSPFTGDSQSLHVGATVPSNSKDTHIRIHSKGRGEKASPAYFKITEKEKDEIARLGEQLIADLKFNVFAFIGKVNNQAGHLPPIDKIIKIAKNALKTKPKNVWAYFAKALSVEMPRAFAKLREEEGESYKDQDGVPEAMKEIMQKALGQEVRV